MRPRIGVTSAPSLRDQRRVEHVDRAYTEAVLAGGALPCVLPVLDGGDADEALARLDGLLLTGGGDVTAAYYGQDPSPEAYGSDYARDRWELALVAAARASGVPILGVCRGAQVLNVAAGGTLTQHLPVVTEESHREYERDGETVHPVQVDPAGLLATITGERAFGVNSLHHQAVARVGPSLRPVAWSPDGVIEALESVDGGPVLGVQWHPELLVHQPAHPAHLRLFAWLAQAAADRRSAMV